MKVYCKNCKWFKRKGFKWDCNYRSPKYLVENKDECTGITHKHYERRTAISVAGYARMEHTVFVTSALNKNNDCEYYKLKWWKFWMSR